MEFVFYFGDPPMILVKNERIPTKDERISIKKEKILINNGRISIKAYRGLRGTRGERGIKVRRAKPHVKMK